MNNVFNYIFKITSDAEKVTAGMNKLNASVDKIEHSTLNMDKTFGKAFRNMQRDIATIKLTSILDQVDRVATGLNTLNKPGMDLSTNMYDLQAITGVAGEKLKEIEGYARESGKTFGGSAADGVEAYKLILSQLNPEIAKVPVALKTMGNDVSILSKLMGGDTAAATEVLTTAMNQYQVSTEDPIQASKEMSVMMNVMAKAAQEGSAELPQIKGALEKAGMAAKGANVSFAETNAAIQILDKAGKKGSEGGVALINTLATLSQGRFLPKDVQEELAKAGVDINILGDKTLTMADRMKPLRAIMNDSALVTKLFGKENNNAAIALISGIEEQERLTKAITGTNSAYDQAAIVMEAPAEKNKRLQAQIDDFKISLFNGTNGLMGYASVLGSTAKDFSDLVPLISAGGKVFSTLTSATKLQALWTGIVAGATTGWTVVQAAFNAVMAVNPIVWIVLGVMALVTAIAWVVNSTVGWGEAWKHTINGAKLLFQAYVESVKFYFSTMVNGIMIGINYIKKGWYEFKEAMGLGDSSANQNMLAQINADTEARKKAVVDGAKKIAKLGLDAKDEFVMAGKSIKWKKAADKVSDAIAPPSVPGTADSANANGGGLGVGKPPKTKGNDAVATGGTKNTTIYITLKDLIGELNITGKDFKDSSQQMAEQSQDALLRLLAMATTAGN
ncbi:phage tail tape measure protein [Flavobacterium sp. I-SCBP12n]|uniref:Phage tail tape measure protein n=1 Tax=Flavobacterium pygoscelis TaxID=2893176 RepID=A0A9X1XTI6_9FLAO|nr:phage tail tape measure protein [Flavobacterium pygoscelis]MCK8143210.1 phage tail tape measure protein [Flavobacterium pygoscelis]